MLITPMVVGGQDKVRVQQVQHRIEQLVLAQYPELNYHPIALPESQMTLTLTPNTESLLHMFFFSVQTAPSLAKYCWL